MTLTENGVKVINDNSEARDPSEIESSELSLGAVASAPKESCPPAFTPPSLPASTGSASTNPVAFEPSLSTSPTDTPEPLTMPDAPTSTPSQLPSAVASPASLPCDTPSTAEITNAPSSQVHTAPTTADDGKQDTDLEVPMDVDSDDVASRLAVDPPAWLVNTSMPGYLRGTSKDKAWQELINSLFRLEGLNTITGVSSCFYSSCYATTY